MNVLGIDPGSDGAIAICKGQSLTLVETFPKIDKSEIDFLKLVKRIKELTLVTDCIVIERVHAITGCSAKTTFKFGQNFQMALDAAALSGKPVHLVKPTEWQKPLHRGETPVKKSNGKIDTKATSLRVAKRLFPNESFLKTEKSTKPHDGMVDASLISFYGANYMNKEN